MSEKKLAVKELKIENLRPDVAALLCRTMTEAVHRLALQQVSQFAYTLFRQSCVSNGPEFTVQGVWNSLQETTRDHFINHALPALDHIEKTFEEIVPPKMRKFKNPTEPGQKPGPAPASKKTKKAKKSK